MSAMPIDSQETVYTAELRLLRKVFEASSDLVLARRDADFAEANGGLAAIESEHARATRELEIWHSESADDYWG